VPKGAVKVFYTNWWNYPYQYHINSVLKSYIHQHLWAHPSGSCLCRQRGSLRSLLLPTRSLPLGASGTECRESIKSTESTKHKGADFELLHNLCHQVLCLPQRIHGLTIHTGLLHKLYTSALE